MASLAALLSTRFFPADEASRLVEDTKDPRRTLVFSAIRAESDARFLEAVAAFFETIDWSGVANAEYGHHPVLAILGAARNESATDHLAATDIVQLCKLADNPDSAFALDVVRAVEFDDAAAGARVAERVAGKLVSGPGATGMFSAPNNAVAGVRIAGMLRHLVGDTDAAQLRAVAERGFGHGAYAACVAASIAAKAGLTLPEDVASLQDSRRLCARLVTWVGHALDPALGEDLLELVVKNDWHNGDLEALDLPWSRAVETNKGGKVTVTRLLGSTVLKATGPLDTFAGPPPRKRAAWKMSVKRHAGAPKAAKEMDKAAAESGDAIAFQQADLDARLHYAAGIDDGRERVAELLRRGASPRGHVDAQRQTTLHRAGRSADCADITRRLLVAGADVGALDDQGYGVLDAVSGGTAEHALAAERLVAAGARSHKNRLFDAAEYGYHRMVAPLLRGGADANEARGGKTPAEMAVDKRHMRTAAALGHKG